MSATIVDANDISDENNAGGIPLMIIPSKFPDDSCASTTSRWSNDDWDDDTALSSTANSSCIAQEDQEHPASTIKCPISNKKQMEAIYPCRKQTK